MNSKEKAIYDGELMKRTKKPNAIIIDLEGTLSDHSHRLHHWQNRNYDAYNDGFKLDPVNQDFVNILKNDLRKIQPVKIFICTAKENKWHNTVSTWLRDHYWCKEIPLSSMIDGIKYRDDLDSRASTTVKRDMLRGISEKYNVIAAYDDREDICEMFERNGVKAHLIKLAKSPADILHQAATTFAEKEKEYGTAYLRHGNIMASFFPNGITLKTPEDFFNFHLFELDIIKSNRLASNSLKHKDSWHDKIVYSAMAEGSLKDE